MPPTDEEVAAVLAAAEPTVNTAATEPAPSEGMTVFDPTRSDWRYRTPFVPGVGDPLTRIAAAFESIATSLQILSEAQMTLAQDAVYNTEHK